MPCLIVFALIILGILTFGFWAMFGGFLKAIGFLLLCIIAIVVIVAAMWWAIKIIDKIDIWNRRRKYRKRQEQLHNK